MKSILLATLACFLFCYNNCLAQTSGKVKTLKVKVTADDTSEPIMEAIVGAYGYKLKESSSGTTDRNGEATVSLPTIGNIDISARHDEFWMGTQQLTVSEADDKSDYTVEFRLKRKAADPRKRTLVVWVYERNASGHMIPVSGAAVQMGTAFSDLSITDQKGRAAIDVTKQEIGKDIVVKVDADGFEKTTRMYVVGNDELYYPGKIDEMIFVLEKPKLTGFFVQVRDAVTNLPIPDAAVQIKDFSGNPVSDIASAKNTRGEAEVHIKGDNVNKNLRVVAYAGEYEEKWSDLPAEFKVPSKEPRYFTVYLQKKSAPKQGGEKKYGPYTVVPGQWTPTGLKLKKGQDFRVEATGILQYKDPPNIKNSPDGGGAWGWWQLKGKINEQLIGLGSKGSGYAEADGTIELGAPATYKMGHPEEKALEGSFTVYVFSRLAIMDKNPENNQLSSELYKKANDHLHFLNRLKVKEKIPGRNADEISGEVSYIVSAYNLQGIDRFCIDVILAIYFRIQKDNKEFNKYLLEDFDKCVQKFISMLETKIKNRQL